MFKTNIRNKLRSVKLLWLVSYILILSIPIFISIIVYFMSGQTLESEIIQANTSNLEQAGQMLENNFETIDRLSTEIMLNSKIADLIKNSDSLNYNYQYGVYVASQELKNLKNAYIFIDEFYVYDIKRDTVILPGISSESSIVFKLLHGGNDIGYSQWNDILKEKHKRDYIAISRKFDSGESRDCIAFINSLNPLIDAEPKATLVILIDVPKLLDAFRKMLLIKDNTILMLDEDNNVLVSTSPANNMSTDFKFDNLPDGSGIKYEKINGQPYAISYMSFPNAHMKYISLIPEKVFWEKAEYIRNLTFISILVSILIGGCAANFFLKKSYNPIRNLIKAVAEKTGKSYGAELNEFGFIQETLANTFNEKSEMKQMIEKQNTSLRLDFLTKLLKGRLHETVSIDEFLNTYGISFSSDSFAVTLFYIKDYTNIFNEDKNLSSNKKSQLIHFIISNVVEELANRHNNGYMCEVDNMLACLININNGEDSDKNKELISIAAEAQQFLAEKFDISLTVSISSILNGIEMIPQAYNEALEVIEYKLVVGSNEIQSYDDIFNKNRKERYTCYFPSTLEQQLINSIKIGDFEKSKETLGSVIYNCIEGSPMSVHSSKCLMFDIFSTIIKTIDEIGGFEDTDFLENQNSISRLYRCTTINEMQHELTAVLEYACNYAAMHIKSNEQQQKEMHSRKLTENIIEFIENNYSDNNLNISAIGYKFDMTPTYLSKIFKQNTGEGLLDCISKFRIQKAKELLSNSNMYINEVSEKIGFTDTVTFIRSYKKYEGITPGQYRNIKHYK